MCVCVCASARRVRDCVCCDASGRDTHPTSLPNLEDLFVYHSVQLACSFMEAYIFLTSCLDALQEAAITVGS